MPRHRFLSVSIMVLLTFIAVVNANAASFDTELHHRILNSSTAAGPHVAGDVVLFSYDAPSATRAVSLAFEHEDYRTFHTFERNRHGVFVLTVPIPGDQASLRYRMVVDGLWTVDPNAASDRDHRGILVSSVTLPGDNAAPAAGVTVLGDGRTRFIYKGERGLRVSLVGDFNRWDPYLTPMVESYAFPGTYEIELRLPPEASFYRFVVNGREITDPANPASARNGWGLDASPIG